MSTLSSPHDAAIMPSPCSRGRDYLESLWSHHGAKMSTPWRHHRETMKD